MFDKIKDWFMNIFSIAKIIKPDTKIDKEYQNNLELWQKLYQDKAPWLKENEIFSIGIPSYICEYLSKITLSDLKTEVQGNDYINSIYQNFNSNLIFNLEKALALGSIIFKPFFDGQHIYIDIVTPFNFLPIKFNQKGDLIEVIFYEVKEIERMYYTRIEDNVFDEINQTFTITHKVYKSSNSQNIGSQIPINNSPWSDLEEIIVFENIKQPLYGYFKVPKATNNKQGNSIFSKAISLIKQTDLQYSRLLWEFESGERKIFADITIVPENPVTLFEKKAYIKLQKVTKEGLLETFNPEVREQSFINGLEINLINVEKMIGLSRGTLSRMDTVTKTATEIKRSKQDTYQTINAIQQSLKTSIQNLIYSLFAYNSIYALSPSVDYELILDFGDSIMLDIDTELKQKILLKEAGVLSKAEIRSWYTGETLEYAQEQINKLQDDVIND